MDFLYGFLVALSVCGVIVVLAVTVTKEKLNVSNNMLGTGIAVMVMGFLANAIMVLKYVAAVRGLRDDLAFYYAALSVIGLMIGLAGIVLMAVGILKACREAGQIGKSRYESYLKLYEKAMQINEWELK